jgi:hypothetical protein
MRLVRSSPFAKQSRPCSVLNGVARMAGHRRLAVLSLQCASARVGGNVGTRVAQPGARFPVDAAVVCASAAGQPGAREAAIEQPSLLLAGALSAPGARSQFGCRRTTHASFHRGMSPA